MTEARPTSSTDLQWTSEVLESTPDIIRIALQIENPPPPSSCNICGQPTTRIEDIYEFRQEGMAPVVVSGIPANQCTPCSERLDEKVITWNSGLANLISELGKNPLR